MDGIRGSLLAGLDGRFVIPRVPVGKVKVSALLPATMAQVEKEVEVHAGELVDVTITRATMATLFA